jgi:soluble lytic murein transglycosylase-like protein
MSAIAMLPSPAVRRTCNWKRLVSFVLTALLTVTGTSSATGIDVYAATAADGSISYSTQAFDTSYTRIFQASASQSVVAAPRRNSNSDKKNGQLAALQPIIDRVAKQHGVDARLIRALISVESRYNPRAISPKGAVGAMQLMPATGSQYGVNGRQELQDPERNISAGVRHFKSLLATHKGNLALALAAYNAGTGAVTKHGERIPPYSETMLYVAAVLAEAQSPTHLSK